MSSRAVGRVVGCDECTVDFSKTLGTVLQSLSHVMTRPQRCLFVHQNVELDPNAVSAVVCCNALEPLHNGREAVGQVHELLECPLRGCFSRESRDVLKARVAPVVNDEQ